MFQSFYTAVFLTVLEVGCSILCFFAASPSQSTSAKQMWPGKEVVPTISLSLRSPPLSPGSHKCSNRNLIPHHRPTAGNHTGFWWWMSICYLRDTCVCLQQTNVRSLAGFMWVGGIVLVSEAAVYKMTNSRPVWHVWSLGSLFPEF